MIDCLDPEVCGVSRHRSIANCKAAPAVEEVNEESIEVVSINPNKLILFGNGKNKRRR